MELDTYAISYRLISNCVYSYCNIYNLGDILEVISLNKMNLEEVSNAPLKPGSWYKVILASLETTAFSYFHYSIPLRR